jgi:hypothetical protein
MVAAKYRSQVVVRIRVAPLPQLSLLGYHLVSKVVRAVDRDHESTPNGYRSSKVTA